jgi:chemotaxis methyl-accepting protein methylase
MNSTLKRNLLYGLGLSLILLFISSFASYISIKNLIQSSEMVRRSSQIIENLNNMLSVVKDAETDYSLAKLNDELKAKIIFSTHNLASENSFNEFQLILCRNVIIYFDRSLQAKVFELFDNSLEKFGYLALGSKETLDFSTISKKYKRLDSAKIWRKIN